MTVRALIRNPNTGQRRFQGILRGRGKALSELAN